MKLKFFKNEHEDITVHFQEGSEISDFSYSEMVKKIYFDKIIEDPIVEGEFTEIECNSISELIKMLRNASSLEDDEQSFDEITEDA